MGTDGLPLNRRERGDHQDIIAGADFLSVLMESPALRQAYRELSTTEQPRVTRINRSTLYEDSYEFTKIPHNPFFISTETKISSIEPKLNTTDNGLTISTDTVLPEIDSQTAQASQYVNSISLEVTTPGAQNLLEEERPSLLSESSKSEFGVEETEPITFPDYLQGYTAKVEPLNNNNHAVTHSQSIIYHHNPIQSNHERSVSYSTVIQALPKQDPMNWNDESLLQHHNHGERKERHYDIKNIPNENKFEKNEGKYKNKETSFWEKPEPLYTATEKNWQLPEKDHGIPEMPYVTPSTAPTVNQRYPIIYGKPEDNYEVDEAVSVMSSGRIHGIQPPKKNDNQKVGYVVEGRNYRKYRVEERTSDGFIVGEYGVVSHDDGSLRGVRYTADGTINPRLIHDALMKFLSL